MADLITVVIPAYNEAERLPSTLRTVTEYFATTGRRHEILVVDDGSGDGTADVVADVAATNPHVRLIQLPRNIGKGGAVRAGSVAAQGETCLFMDADLSTPMHCLAALEAALSAGADVAIGSRAHPAAHVVLRQAAPRQCMGQVFNVAVRMLTGLRWRDTQCGFKLFRVEALRRILPLTVVDGFAFDVEWLVIAREAGLTVAECPVEWRNDARSTVSMVQHPRAMLVELWVVRRRWLAGGYRPLASRTA